MVYAGERVSGGRIGVLWEGRSKRGGGEEERRGGEKRRREEEERREGLGEAYDGGWKV